MKTDSPRFRKLTLVTCFLLCLQQVLFVPLLAAQDGVVPTNSDGLPSGAQIVAGAANIQANGSNLNINSLSDRTIINWDQFSVNAGNAVNFNQPGINSAVLNRVISDNPSAILGSINSNGNVLLVNPNGILIGPTGVINTNGFTASVLDISNRDFLDGGDLTFSGSSEASVVNLGSILTGDGGVNLLGNQVINEGLIETTGNINLISGGTVKLNNGVTYTQADAATIQNGISETAGLIRNSGTLRATGAMEVGGEVYLVAPGGKVFEEGMIAATKGSQGGKVVATGQDVELVGSKIDVSGANGGGQVNIGGGFQGRDPQIQNSLSTTIDSDSTIFANALAQGDGGTVVVWSDVTTEFTGSIFSKGGVNGGNGGLVEVSGSALAFSGQVDTTAPLGNTGTLLLDPVGIRIISGGLGRFQPGTDPVLTITDGQLNNLLNFNSIVLATSSVNTDVLPAGGIPSGRGFPGMNDDNIVVSAGTNIDTESNTPGVFNTLYFSTSRVDLYSAIRGQVAGGTSSGTTLFPPIGPVKDPSVVNVFGSASGGDGSIQNAVDLVGTGGTVNVNAGSFDSFQVNRPNLTIVGVGNSSVVNAASPAITIAANNTIIQDLLLVGTGSSGDVGVLLDGTLAPGLTGIEIINVGFSNLDDGILSQGNIGDGVLANTDVLIRGNSSVDTSLFEDFLDSAIQLGDTNGDAVYRIQDITVQDGDANNVSTGGSGIRFDSVGSATIERVDVSETTASAVEFGILNSANVSIANSFLDGGLHGIVFDGDITGASTLIDISQNEMVRGSNQGILFSKNVTDATIQIQGNGTNATNGIIGPADAIAFNSTGSLTDVNFLIGGDSLADGNYIFSNSQALDIDAIDGGRFVVANNHRIRGNDAIEFEGEISASLNGGAEILIVNNQDISSPRHGIRFRSDVNADSNLTIAGNNFSNTVRDAVRFDSGNSITNANVTIGNATVSLEMPNDTVASGNLITGSGSGSGINVRARVQGNTLFEINNNMIGTNGSRVGNDGIAFLGGIRNSSSVNIGGSNEVFATDRAIDVTNLYSSVGLNITGGSYDGNNGGLNVNNSALTIASDGNLAIGDATFTGGAGSTVVNLVTSAVPAPFLPGINVTFSGGTTINGGSNGLSLFGTHANIVGDTLLDSSFAGQTGNYIQLTGGAELIPGFPNSIDATGVTFDGLLPTTMDATQLINLENKISHFPDNLANGLINFDAIVVQPFQSIQLAVNFAGNNGIGNVVVANGLYGGSVEVWVDGLNLLGQGPGTIINTNGVDFFANNGDVGTGFNVTDGPSGVGTGDVTGVTIDGFNFISFTLGPDNTGVLLGSGAGSAVDTTIQNSLFGNLRQGIQGSSFGGSTTIFNVRMGGISRHGINLNNSLNSGSLLVEESNIIASNNALRINGNINDSSITMSGNTLSSLTGDAIAFLRPINDSSVLIGGPLGSDANLIGGFDDGINVDALNNTDFTVENNTAVAGVTGSGIEFDSTVGPFSSVQIIDNSLIAGGEEGIEFDTNISLSQVNISGNNAITGGLDAIQFKDEINLSLVSVGNNLLINSSGGDGIVFEDSIAGSFIFAGNNLAVNSASGRGISFEDTIALSGVLLLNNNVNSTSGDGIFFGDEISLSAIGVVANRVNADNEAIQFSGDISTSIVGILFNQTFSNGSGIAFSDRSGADTVIDDSFVIIAGNRIDGPLFNPGASPDFGIQFEGITGNSTVIVRSNNIIEAGEDGILVQDAISDNALLRIRGNTLGAQGSPIGSGGTEDNGIDIDQVDSSRGVQILENEIFASANAIEFDGNITDSPIEIFDNPNLVGINGDAVKFESQIAGTSSILIDNNFMKGVNGLNMGDFGSIVDSTSFVVTNNSIESLAGSGIRLVNLGSSQAALIDNNEIAAGDFGVSITQLGDGGFAGSAILSNLTITDASIAGVNVLNLFPSNSLDVTLQDNVQIIGGLKGLLFDGPNLSLAGDTLGDTSFVGNTGNFIELRNGALFDPGQPTLIDATNVNFDGIDSTTLTGFVEIQGRIVDYIDDPTLGLIWPGFKDLSELTFNLNYDQFERYADWFETVQLLFDQEYPGTINYGNGGNEPNSNEVRDGVIPLQKANSYDVFGN